MSGFVASTVMTSGLVAFGFVESGLMMTVACKPLGLITPGGAGMPVSSAIETLICGFGLLEVTKIVRETVVRGRAVASIVSTGGPVCKNEAVVPAGSVLIVKR